MYSNQLYLKIGSNLMIRVNSFELRKKHEGCKILLRMKTFQVDESFGLNYRIATIKKVTTENVVVKMECNNVFAILKERDIECLLIELKRFIAT
ncbi:hypothetical protein PD280_22665 [Virgibacillus salarius]|uniref:hypothetical protein n=1 Tax=Virgibacillus salarius TaxID=447199 RepID=UPI00249133E1|nr:hypothetical protein [Virgibacillus salarius]WBX80334.1 hypothetical protein PD280_22665 [Virgibacillus salarius]